MKTPNPGRHASECKICSHPLRDEIERDFINWRSPAAIAKQYKLANRASVYRHAHALGLFAKRQRNVRAALEKIIERAAESLLASWKFHEEGMVMAFIPKRVRVGCLASLACSLCAVGEAFDTLNMTVIKYWDDPDSKVTPPIDLADLMISEFALAVPTRIRWGSGDHLVVSDVMSFLYC